MEQTEEKVKKTINRRTGMYMLLLHEIYIRKKHTY